MSLAIEVTRLRKSYGNHTVLKGLDFQVKKRRNLRPARHKRRRKDHGP